MGDWSTSAAYEDYGSTQAHNILSSNGIGGLWLGALGSTLGPQQSQITATDYQRRGQLSQQWEYSEARRLKAIREAEKQTKKGFSMVDEFRTYVREYKDWIFTIAIVAVIDHFFLDGALKEKLAGALGKKLDADNGKAGA